MQDQVTELLGKEKVCIFYLICSDFLLKWEAKTEMYPPRLSSKVHNVEEEDVGVTQPEAAVRT